MLKRKRGKCKFYNFFLLFSFLAFIRKCENNFIIMNISCILGDDYKYFFIFKFNLKN